MREFSSFIAARGFVAICHERAVACSEVRRIGARYFVEVRDGAE